MRLKEYTLRIIKRDKRHIYSALSILVANAIMLVYNIFNGFYMLILVNLATFYIMGKAMWETYKYQREAIESIEQMEELQVCDEGLELESVMIDMFEGNISKDEAHRKVDYLLDRIQGKAINKMIMEGVGIEEGQCEENEEVRI